MTTANRYSFDPTVPADEIESTLVIAVLAAEALHGVHRVRFGAAHALDPVTRTVVLAARGRAARDLNVLFASFAEREFGPRAFVVTPAVAPVTVPATAAA
jgi:hypothetical protein